MAGSQAARSRRLAAKAARRKVVVAEKRKAEAALSSGSLGRRVVAAANRPLARCAMTSTLFEHGIGQVVLARQLLDGRIGVAFFLVDVHCLGVKDAFYTEMPPDEFREKMQHLAENCEVKVEEVAPSYARALLHAAVAYARDIGFPPAEDYDAVESFFGEIPAEQDTEGFVFGQNGKPLYVAGPSDTPARSRKIIEKLRSNLGPDGFHFIAPLPV
jgi:hypothetical protein